MTRRAHKLGHNSGSEYPRDVVVFDTETTEFPLPNGDIENVLAFGWACHTRRYGQSPWRPLKWFRYTTRFEFADWLERRTRNKGRLNVYCHNAAFDVQVMDMFGELNKRGWILESACLEGPPTIIRWTKGKRTIVVTCTLNIWRTSLAAIGASIGLAKLEQPGTWIDRVQSDTYCKRDVEIVWEALRRWWEFLQREDLGTAQPTLASQAFSAYRHRFMNHKIFCDANADALKLSRQSYLGGRCEAFRIGRINKPITVLDINSMYPSVMATELYPTEHITTRGHITKQELGGYLTKYCLVAEVDLNTLEPAYPHILNNRLCFPVGKFTQTLTTPELQYALEHNHITRIRKCAVYERAPIFTEFIDWGWNLRMKARAEGNKTLDWQVKIMLNSLYGKFGQRGRKWEIVDTSPDWLVKDMSSLDLDTGNMVYTRQIGHTIQRMTDEPESFNSSPAIASHVTAYARLKLWRLILAAGRHNVWYVDTDSLTGSTDLAERLAEHIDPNTLGKLKVEHTADWIEINGPKDYRYPGKTAHKGVSANAIEVGQGRFTQLQWMGWAGAIRRGRLDCPSTTVIEKRRIAGYGKGRVADDGTVSPFEL